MALLQLAENFKAFFGNLNPGDRHITNAANEHAHITRLISDPNGPAAPLSPHCFLQGSYKQQTAIYDINDVDVVALCRLWQPAPAGSGPGDIWTRDRIFSTIATAIGQRANYAGRIEYGPTSTCIKVNAAVRIEVLPVVYAAANSDSDKEPFRLFRPESQLWEDGYARYHQGWLTWKNGPQNTTGTFIPAIKVFKHVRSRFKLAAVSFHLECLLFSLPNELFVGSPADYLPALFNHIAGRGADDWYREILRTPCRERDIFTAQEWSYASWSLFHDVMKKMSVITTAAGQTTDREQAIELWQIVLGNDFFPHL